jgi:N-acylneuraminate cytidylyltransferase
MAEETAWVVIPARGGSKGIPGKNLKKIGGRSLIRRAVDAALAASLVSRVVVSTEDAAIAAEAKAAGADIVIRPAALASDVASSESALLHALDALEHEAPGIPDILVFVQCTSPFIVPDDIDGTIRALTSSHADTAFTGTLSHGFLWQRDFDGNATGINHDKLARQRRQDREAEFLETGSVYAMRVNGFRAARHRFFGKTVVHEVTSLTAFEIDEPEDLARARALAPLCDRISILPAIPSPLGGILFDFDGVMTDDRVSQDADGIESVVCSRADGYGIEMLHAAGVPMAVISREPNPVVSKRCEKLKLRCLQAVDDKLSAMTALAATWNTSLKQIIYVGNDLPDLPCVAAAGLGVAVADAHPDLRAAADLVLQRDGGFGAVRELAELVLAARIIK